MMKKTLKKTQRIKEPINYVKKLSKLAAWSEIGNCGYPTMDTPVELYCEWKKNPACRIYVCYSFRKWVVSYTTDEAIDRRIEMEHSPRLSSDKAMIEKVKEILEIFESTIDK